MGCVSSDRSSCSFDLCCHWLDLRLGLSVQWSRENNFALWLSVQLRFCIWNQRIAPQNWWSCSPVPPFPPRMSFSWLCERWCLFLLACSRRRWATDFTHFYWLIWLCSCQQLRVSQESEILRDSATATASVVALSGLGCLEGAVEGRGGRLSPVS